MTGPTELLTKEEVALRLHVHPDTVKRWALEGKIPEVRISHKTRRYSWEAVCRALEALQPAAAAATAAAPAPAPS